MLVQEDGPGRSLVKLRELTGIEHDGSGKAFSYGDWTPLHCVWCTSLWVAPIVALLPVIVQRWLAASTLAIIIHEKLT
jgi:hypothetical protein